MYETTKKSYISSRKEKVGQNGTQDLNNVSSVNQNIEESSYDVDLKPTCYMKLEDIREKNNENHKSVKQFFFKNEFPVASVILTIVFTMMAMLLTCGFGNV